MRKPIKAYLITDPFLYPQSPLEFYKFYQKVLKKHRPQFAAYRDKTMLFDSRLLEIFLELNCKFNVISLINSNANLGLKLGFDGVHCNGAQLDQIQNYKKRFQYVFYSAHNLQDLDKADKMGASGITISPIFQSPNKGIPLGIEFLKRINPKDYQAEIFALGGIVTEIEIDVLKQTQIHNFASIRYFLN
ncbi:thiamine phosphate synthase [Helicobacter winghamensis]|uniref:Thiamine phosphate synthase n=1 Tax=Helicobacter winghamensis TaxID=157268 RepID=A0A2N3PIJ8_9HELI|nr:thiamine phosphate synthase [Helicobacter winghamensis]PKT76114.1 thiamine phosphate synthase [Helicobacter winghamensis]PKT76749.1 thiamine phosphate synthase [Helicobacter winghamensis]PKT76870.1 thiamine phosphate synthase [Helicobacter winghamensis]PKT80625.1 thiamine phosphate synthase [Helicobacter winghamensis]PKT80994.1 thiamine phosphate synthase [Helicobacter winghamensis]